MLIINHVPAEWIFFETWEIYLNCKTDENIIGRVHKTEYAGHPLYKWWIRENDRRETLIQTTKTFDPTDLKQFRIFLLASIK